ncbi:Iron import ATP-binding/permease protein IrtA [Thiorhodovibrio winogradskyi]|uniref:Iron import ATP-binding/permease protein IrtA n=1 Tax=Thiorhodovibrio winogradskyi TaxID=77007 RepID=A0ABZ0S995_9GAMM|nr:ABC transporter ATP-binding protein [Thiorhodovibrio winogradskyi]
MIPADQSPTAEAPPVQGRAALWSIMNPVRGQIRFAMLLAIGSAVLGLGAMGGLAFTVHRLLEAPGVWPWPTMAAVLACTAAAYSLRLIAFDQSHYAAFRLETILRTQLAEHLGSVSMGHVQAMGAGALSKVMYDDIKALHVFVADSTPLYARAYATPVATFFVLLWLDWRLALGATAVLVFGFGVLSLALRDQAEMTRRYNAAREGVSAAIIEYVQAMPVVRTFDSGQATFGRYQRALEAYLDMVMRWYRDAGFAARFSMATLNPMPTLAVLLWLGVWFSWHDSLAFSHWLAVLLVGTGMAESMLPMMMLKHMVDKVKLSVARIQQVMALPIQSAPAPGRAQIPTDASVRFEGVGFRYGEGDAEALRDVSFSVSPGAVTALVGPSGAGKSTVAKLIPRFWDVTAGRILVGGADVREMTADTLMGQVAFVFQDTFLFSGSIADNIRLGLPETAMDAVEAAARAAQAHDFITALPRGYDTPVGERGLFLSGGQRQRITIARAILQDHPILVLDEATAHADPENEAALVAALSALIRGKTVIVVAHRLATIRDADQILVFDRGRLTEAGRHQALVTAGGAYARLWRGYERAQHWALGEQVAATAGVTP